MAFSWLAQLHQRLLQVEGIKPSIISLGRVLITTSLLMTGSVLGMRYLGLIEAAELAAYDQYVQLRPALGPDDRLLVVGITEEDLQTLQEWPISDRSLALAVEQLAPHYPEVIAIDIFRDFPHQPGSQALQTRVQSTPNTLMICKISAINDIGIPPPSWVAPEKVGFADLVVDPGGILRRSLLMSGTFTPATPFPKQHLCNQPEQVLLSLSFKAALQYLQAQGIEPQFDANQQLRLGAVAIPAIGANTGGYRGVDNAGYQILLNYRSEANAVTEVSLMELINGQVSPELIRDRIVFIGYTTPQAKDEFYTPYSSSRADEQKMPGVVVHAQSASQLLSTVLDGRPLIWVWPTIAEIGWIFIWSLAGGLLAWCLRRPAIFALVIFLGCSSLYGLCFWLFIQGGWIPVVPPSMAFIATAVGVVALDRFNNSPYGQQVYRKVKTFLRLDIDIDEAKVVQQVSEITNTDYFRHLKEKVSTLQNQPLPAVEDIRSESYRRLAQFPRSPNSHIDASTQNRQIGFDAIQTEAAAKQQPELSKTETLSDSQTVEEATQQGGPSSATNLVSDLMVPTANAIAINDFEAAEPDFLQQIADKAAALKRSPQALTTTSNPPGQTRHAVSEPRKYELFVLDATDGDYCDRSPITQEYLTQLLMKLANIKANLPNCFD